MAKKPTKTSKAGLVTGARTSSGGEPGLLPGLQGVKRTPGAPTKLEGSPGVYSYGGRLVSFEKRPELVGRNAFVTYDNLVLNTIIVGAAVRYYQALIGGASWTVTAKEGAPQGERAAEIVTEGLIEASMVTPWSSVVKRAALYRYYGFSIHEWCVRRRPSDGMIVFSNIEHRPQHTVDMWDIPQGGGYLQGIVQLVPTRPEYFYVPRERMFYCVDSTLTDSPDGVGLLRHVVEHGRRLQRYEQLEGFGFEGNLRGMPVGKVPGAELQKIADAQGKPKNWVDDQTAAVLALVQNHIKTPFQGIMLDSEPYSTAMVGSMNPSYTNVPKWAIDIIKGDAAGLPDVQNTIERLNREIARVLGMEFLLLGADGKGSLALSRDKTSMFASLLESTLGELANFAKQDLVYPLLELNGIDPEENAPQVNPDPIATERIEAVIAALVGLAQAGAPLAPNDPVINQVRGRLHLADAPEIDLASLAIPRGKPGAPGGKNPKDPSEQGVGKPNIAAEERAGSAVANGENGSNKVETAMDKGRDVRKLFRVLDPETGELHTTEVFPEHVVKMITRRRDGWHVLSDDGTKHLGGPYKTKTQAVARLRQVEGHKEDK